MSGAPRILPPQMVQRLHRAMGRGQRVVGIGSRVEVEVRGELPEQWQIVSPDEADVRRRRLSTASPLARALLGHAVGEEVVVQLTVAGHCAATILRID